MRGFTDFLYARPSFIEGVARVLDIGGTLNVYNSSPTGSKADSLALDSDCLSIGDDWLSVLDRQKSELPALKQELLNEAQRILHEGVDA